MNEILNFLSDIKVVIAIAVVVVILILWLIIQHVNTGKYRKQLERLEAKYNDIRNVPLAYKMKKAAELSRVDSETSDKVNNAKAQFDASEAELKEISESLADAEDLILVGKLKKASAVLDETNAKIDKSKASIQALDQELDTILARETELRQKATALKNRFRALKTAAEEHSAELSYSWSNIEQKVSSTEKMFSTFEEWSFSGDYDKAGAELDEITTCMASLEKDIEELPQLLQDARGTIPNLAENLHSDFIKNRNRGVYLKHLEVEKNLSVLTAALKEDLKQLKQGNTEEIGDHLAEYRDRIEQMDSMILKEGEAFDTIRSLSTETEELFDTTEKNIKYVKDNYQKTSVRFGLEGMEDELKAIDDDMQRLTDAKPRVFANAANYQIPASSILVSLKDFNNDLTVCNDSLKKMKEKIEMASGDEDRARKQLVKLQIIMNQMQVKIRKYKLPNISRTYHEDMDKAEDYISKLNGLIEENPLNVQVLNSVLQEALDFIYKLYNNVNNVVGTVVMVENTIVFGNRYRSTYVDIDSELTRAELAFRNGEYTNALTMAIATIEKIHPGNYESMIKENAKGA